jgi:UDP-N-acetylmuramoylalanine--D-glutamate ligase
VETILNDVDTLLPAPGVPESHEVILQAKRQGVEVLSEIELAYRFEQERPGGPRPMVAVTGTDGKTTTTLMAAAILDAAGLRCAAVGNTETPLIAALKDDFDAFAVECSSFRLAFTQSFRCAGSAWLNIAPDHLDWHRDMDSYRRAKAQIWSYLRPGDVAVAPVVDPTIHTAAMESAGRTITFGIGRGDYHTADGVLLSPHGTIVEERAMSRALPHDVTNALAATAICVESGLAEPVAAGAALRGFRHARHRIELVGERGGVRWYDDSKATSPHAVGVAIRSFERVVLIAGGRNKGLDLSAMADESARIRSVVLIGDAADELARIFDGRTPTQRASSMTEAVERAASLSEPGDVVLLSPGCTSFDWYSSYGERGDDFQRIVRETVIGKRSLIGRLKKGSH